MMGGHKSQSALAYVLKGLLPYSRENLQLAYHPNKFFDELERLSGLRRQTLQAAMWRAQERGLIEREGHLVKLTELGKQKAQPLKPKKLAKHVQLMVIFDIPENVSSTRRRLRRLLQEWGFTQVQKSVWISKEDYGEALVKAVQEMDISPYVQIYESARLFPK